jgi:carboxyl-terminal processing protease
MVLSAGVGFWVGQREISARWKDYRPEITVVNKAVPPRHQDVDFSLFWEVWDRLEKDYLDSSALDKEKMVYGAISGMTSALGDPYTVFLPPKKQTETKEELSGAFEGVGIQLGYKDNRLAVIAPLDGMPAKQAGILAGDFIIHIKDEVKKIDKDTDGMTLPDAVEIIRGPRGQPVILTIVRDSKDPLEFTLVRDTIIVKSVSLEWIDPSDQPSTINHQLSTIAYVRLSRFGDRTVTEWNDVVEEIIKKSNQKDAQVAGMILDVRNNPGGYLDAAVAVASEFFSGGLVVEQKSKTTSYPFNVARPGKLPDIPLVVLVNQGSASASEIVAGAIGARGRGKLVGQNTFGKGTVQDAQELRGGAGLHITTARWLLPSGGWIHDEGLKPDIELEYDQEASKDQKWDNQVQEAVKLLISN